MKYFAANWKLQKSPKDAREFVAALSSARKESSSFKMIFFPSAIALEAFANAAAGKGIGYGPQNVFFEGKGAFTGENSAMVAKELGCEYVLLGHSERRTLFSETDELIAKKTQYVQSLGLTPIVCFGETLKEREEGKTKSVLTKQLENSLVFADRSKPLLVAYEPVWAIGTGKVATPAQVAEAHAQSKKTLVSLGFSANTPLLYGGSVKAESAQELIGIPNVDGFLIGGASLEVKSYLDICACV